MAVIELAALTSPVSDDDPCGVDLDLAGDPEFMNYMARAEGLLPSSYFSGPDEKPFDRGSIDFNAEFETAKPFLAKTRDIRLLVLFAKFCVLTRDIEGFSVFVGAVEKLLDDYWDAVHPREGGDEFAIRLAVLDTLDDSAPVVMPLQYVRLIEDKRAGPISYRSFMFANGEAQPRNGEEAHDLTTLDRAMMEAELATLIERRRQIEAVQTALAAIGQICVKRTGRAASFEKLAGLTAKIFELLNATIAKRDPTAAIVVAADEASEAPAVVGRIASKTDAGAALAAVARYFNQAEPSNPALLLVRQAEQLMGKSLLEVMQILMPSQLGEVKFWIGKDRAIDIPIERLAPFATIEPVAADMAAESSNGGERGDHGAGGESGETKAADPDAPQQQWQPIERRLAVRNRQEAFAMLEQVTGYFRVAEPSSPIALITERARGLADRDFLTLLKELLPPAS